MKPLHLALAIGASALIGLQAGCRGKGNIDASNPLTRPADDGTLVRSPRHPGQLVIAQDREAQVLAELQPAPPPVWNDEQPDAGYALNAMVGQVNGQAIYANTVLFEIEDQLKAIARRPNMTRAAFRDQASRLIAARVQQIVLDALIYGEAERDLSEGEQEGLKQLVKTKREELLRIWGMGSPTLADMRLKQETGLTLEETVEDWRKQAVVQKYLREKLLPRINVTRRDIERYYREHEAEEFRPGATRTIRIIRVYNEEDVQAVDRLLTQAPFEEVARNPINLYKPQDGGLFGEGIGQLRDGPLNDAMLELQEGEHAGPVRMGGAYWYVFVEQLDAPEHRTLQQAQIEIENKLRNRQYQVLSEKYRADLFRFGSYNSLEQMIDELVDIAMNRYAPRA